MGSPTPLRRELLISLGILFGGATLLLGISLSIVLPLLRSPGEATLFILLMVGVDLLILLFFGGWMLKKGLLEPVQGLVRGVEKIAEGDYGHRLDLPAGLEFRSITEGVNAMADRLIADQEALAENVRSLEETNRELIEARSEVIQSARLASAGTLAAGIAHEVGNPLGAIIGFTDVAVRRIEADGGDPELLVLIRSEAKRIDRIVRSLLDYARPRTDDVAPVQVRSVVERVRELLTTQGRLTRVEHRWNLAEDCPPVLIDEQHLEQVLVNLVVNALDALEGRSDATLNVDVYWEDGPASLPPRREGDAPGINYMHRRRVARDHAVEEIGTIETSARVVVMSVADNGPGIPEANLAHVFDPFFTTKEPGKGTGVGLFISARLVNAMGGRMEVENRSEGGARFLVRFPQAAVKDATTTAAVRDATTTAAVEADRVEQLGG